MATPNMPSSAQDIINNFLSGGYASEAIANPYRVDVDPFRPPVSDTPEDDKSPTDPCPEGYVYDPVIKSCVPIEQESGDRPDEPDREQMMFEQMKKDPTTGFGASNILDDYITEGLGQGTFLKFDPNVGKPNIPLFPLASAGLGFLDTIFGGDKRRLNTYNEALKFMEDNAYGQSIGNDLFKIFTPTEYYRRTSGSLLNPQVPRTPQGQNVTVGEAVEAVINQQKDGSYPTAEGTGSGRIAEDLTGGLLYTTPLTSVDSSGNRTRNDDAYRAGIARNIERNKKNFGSSGFSMNVGGTGMAGFTRGR